MARISISIPDELKERMDGLNCNWSAIAQTAFTTAVEIETLKNEGDEMEAGLIRLRASKQENIDREDALGYPHGQNWALEDATYDELKKMAGMVGWVQQHPDRQEEALAYLNDIRDKYGLDLPGMPKSNVTLGYALQYFQGAADVFSKI